MIILAIIFSIVLTRTPFGRWLYATGSNERAAQLSGVPVKQVQDPDLRARPACALGSSGSCRWPTSAPRPPILGRSTS